MKIVILLLSALALNVQVFARGVLCLTFDDLQAGEKRGEVKIVPYVQLLDK